MRRKIATLADGCNNQPDIMKPLHIKRLAFIAALALLPGIGAGAQIYLGGGLGLTTSPSGNSLSLVLNPDIACRVSNSFVVGGQLSFRTGYEGMSVVPYARWHVTSLDSRLSLFVSADAPCTFRNKRTDVYLQVRPGLSLSMSDNLYLLAYFGAFGWSATFENGRPASFGWISRLDRDSINLGFCVAL